MAPRPATLDVDTPVGLGRLVVDPAPTPRALLLLGHGAGGGVEAFDLAALAATLPSLGVTVLRFEQPWRTAGRRVAGPAKQLDSAWQSALTTITDRWPDIPLVVGGRSAGARVACRCFASPARGVVALAFPLHPPGRPASSRAAELDAVEGPVLIVQGERDPFGTSDEVRRAFPGRDVVNVAGAVHGLGPTRKADDPTARAAAIVEPVARFVSAVTGGGQLPRTSARS